MPEVICDLCELPMSQCPHGRGYAERPGTPRFGTLVADGPTIVATQNSPCVGCNDRIQEGESITHTEDGWAHADEVVPTISPVTTEGDLFDGL